MSGPEEGAQSRDERVEVFRDYGAGDLARWLVETEDDYQRMRLAWLSARRGRARESEFAAEALAIKDAEIARLQAEEERLAAEIAFN